MSDKLLLSTRKGLFTVTRQSGRWDVTAVDFLGDNVTLTLTDCRDGGHYAALDHGHFGVKLHRSTATGWEEIAVPTYPPKPDGYEENDMWGRPINWSTARIWALAAGGAAFQRGDALFQYGVGRIADAAVDIAEGLQPEQRGGMIDVVGENRAVEEVARDARIRLEKAIANL